MLEGTRATGLEAIREDTGERVTYEGDHVILCLGTYQSPAVLLRSGVGPADADGDLARQLEDLAVQQEEAGQRCRQKQEDEGVGIEQHGALAFPRLGRVKSLSARRRRASRKNP